MKQPKPGSNSAAMDNLGGLEKETARTVEVAEKAVETCEKLSANTAALDKVAKAIEDSTKKLKAKNDSLAIRLGKIVAALVILLAGIAAGALSLGTSGLNYGQAVAAATQAIDTSERVDAIRTQVESVDRKADKILLAQESPVVVAPPAPAPGDYAGQSTRFNVATRYCKSLVTMTPAGRDGAAKKLEALKEKEFQEQMWDCYDPNWRVNGKRVGSEDNTKAKSASYRQRGGYDSFDNVAEGSRHVRTRRGKSYDLGNLRGSPESCQPPRKWHRTEVCKPIGNGGITCKMACR